MSEESQKPAPEIDAESSLPQEQTADGDAVLEASEPDNRKTLDFSGEDGPSVEIGDETDLMTLSHEMQVEIALADLDDYQSGDRVARVEEEEEKQNFGLDIAPDPDFFIVTGQASASLSSPPLPVDLLESFEVDLDFQSEDGKPGAAGATSEPGDLFPVAAAKPAVTTSRQQDDHQRDTIVPPVPLTMEMLDEEHRKTREYPPELINNLQTIPEFNLSPERQAYDEARRNHWQKVKMHISGVDRHSSFPEPPSFALYFNRFLARKKTESTD